MELILRVVDYVVLGYLFYPYELYPNLIKNVKIYLTLTR
jgi:hypothetical protein